MRQHALSSSAKVSSEHVHREFGAQEEEIQSRDREYYSGCKHFCHLFLGSFGVFTSIDELIQLDSQLRCFTNTAVPARVRPRKCSHSRGPRGKAPCTRPAAKPEYDRYAPGYS